MSWPDKDANETRGHIWLAHVEGSAPPRQLTLGPQDLVWHMRALPGLKLAFEFLVLTAARSGEVRGAEWAEIDTDEGVWTVPASRMRAKREHRVPLSGRALEILAAARKLGGGHRLVFSTAAGKPIHDHSAPRTSGSVSPSRTGRL